jgi:hypothetical protein
MKPSRIRLRGVSVPAEGRTWESDERLRIGRLGSFEVVLEDSSISRQHAEVVWSGRDWAVRDLGSTNGTFLNAVRLGRDEKRLREGDVLQFGTVCLVVESVQRASGLLRRGVAGRLSLRHTARHSWEEVLRLLTQPAPAGAAGLPVLRLLRLGRNFHSCGTLEAALEAVLWEAAETLEAHRGSLALCDPKTGLLRTHATFSVNGRPHQEPEADDDPALRCLNRGEALLYSWGGSEREGEAPAEPVSLLYTPLRLPRSVLGVLCLGRTAAQQPFGEEDLVLAEAIGLTLAPTVDSLRHLFERQQDQFLQTLTVLTELVSLRDGDTGSHGQRVTDYALMLAEEMELSEAQKQLLRIGTPLHDLGKMGVRDSTLQKAGPLSPDEEEQLRASAGRASTLLESALSLAPLVPLVRSHHERWDGSGYPDGLAGPQIPLLARVVALADAFDAMTTDRPYRAALPLEEAFAETRRQAGSQFDPACVEALQRLRPRIEEVFVQKKALQGTLGLEELTKVVEAAES